MNITKSHTVQRENEQKVCREVQGLKAEEYKCQKQVRLRAIAQARMILNRTQSHAEGTGGERHESLKNRTPHLRNSTRGRPAEGRLPTSVLTFKECGFIRALGCLYSGRLT